MRRYALALQAGHQLLAYGFELAEGVELIPAVRSHGQAAFLALKPPRDALNLYVIEDDVARLIGVAYKSQGEITYQELDVPPTL